MGYPGVRADLQVNGLQLAIRSATTLQRKEDLERTGRHAFHLTPRFSRSRRDFYMVKTPNVGVGLWCSCLFAQSQSSGRRRNLLCYW